MLTSSIYIEKSLSSIVSGLQEELSNTQTSVVKKNHLVLQQLTNFVAELNCDFFNEKLKDRLKDNINFLHVIPTSSNPLTDEWGRCTYFFAIIGTFKLLIYQPGTPTFISSVEKDSDLVAIHDNCQQNGAILGMGCACFLADFVTYLCSLYQENCTKMKLDSSNFHPSAYKISLETCLQKFVDEDRDSHGRLIEMKDLLLNLGGKNEIKYESFQPYFYAKDIEVLRGEKPILTSHFYKQLSNGEFTSILEKRDYCRTYQHIEKYFHDNSSSIEQCLNFLKSEPWKIIHDTLMNKNGIFKDPILARRWLTITFDIFEQQLASSISMSSNITSATTVINVSNDMEKLERDYDLLRNEKLMEYFTQVQRGLQSLFQSAVVADADIFAIRTPDLSKNIQVIGDLVPEAKTILQSVSNIIVSINQKGIEKKLDELCNLCVRFPCLPELLARKITIMKRDYIMNLKDADTIGLCSKLDTIVKGNNRSKNWSIQQRLAVRDTKILEACCIQLICQDDINPLRATHVEDIANKISNAFKNTQLSVQISKDLTINEQPIFFQRREPFVIPNSFFEQHTNHKFMKRMANNEDPIEYRDRVKQYLMELSSEKIQDLLGSIDPSDTQLNPLFILLLEVKKEKKNSCTIS
ncbi:unnamed protein product [Rotaria sp. Silwood2]|nr:unnamed protein product [Rotaria sp. Silwood2]CAF2735066.1 unnamed protein product [Rotaria sp. Silwood2]CAF3133415.1 unnamed protein product [Rotaria sp. Silwood2]CAF4119714.1 unnamed protein product [Rotaria sp. Silwood2]CAF4249696.1 unnamed protein product [Rotaria sp. Silwood2]